MRRMDDRAVVQAAELQLLAPDTRRDPSRVRALLHPDFVEIGRSGRRWKREEIVRALADESSDDRAPDDPAPDDPAQQESPRGAPVTDEWHYTLLAPSLTLVTYRVRGDERDSRHSSIWDTSSGDPVLRFHQGTFLGES